MNPFGPPAPLPRFRWWMALLGLLFTAVVVAGVVRMLRPQMDERLYARFRNLPKAQFLTPADSSRSALFQACEAYNLKRYSRAVPLFLSDTSQAYALERRFFRGICLMELEKLQEAEALFKEVRALSAAGSYWKECDWYLALCYLRGHKRGRCIEKLREIRPGYPRGAEAERLWAKLRLM